MAPPALLLPVKLLEEQSACSCWALRPYVLWGVRGSMTVKSDIGPIVFISSFICIVK